MQPQVGVMVLDEQANIVSTVSINHSSPEQQLAWSKSFLPGSSIKPVIAMGALKSKAKNIQKYIQQGSQNIEGKKDLQGVPYGAYRHQLSLDTNNYKKNCNRKVILHKRFKTQRICILLILGC